MVIAGLVLAGIAGLIHVYIFYLESIAWTGARARAVFGIASPADAERTKALAFNQGFYNLFLAIAIAIGIVLFASGSRTVGATLVFVGAGSMVAAGLVLLLSSPAKAGAALKQLVPPLLGIVALAIGLAS
ncbi:DUF1304 domain-containing protein [Micromonospora sp. KC207]|uniref:DUF1304 domain-containing protein n=1 Tax=Micromonospora sp. KC207 TaxID=2530377 RepID=UPI001043CC51|nr:DUF1304 domain-containing protein [Micromonospora sp. KC207]TDC59158.1 DUF1304 domain-containing protein [Micromonospora sp. KC207]